MPENNISSLTEQAGWPQNVLPDSGELCRLYQVPRVKVQQLEGHALVSPLYCFAKLIRLGTISGEVSGWITAHHGAV